MSDKTPLQPAPEPEAMTRKMHGRHGMLRMACYVLVLIIVVVLIATKVVTPWRSRTFGSISARHRNRLWR